MTLAHDLDNLDHINKLETKLRNGIAELERRARISTRRDGYPRQTVGANAIYALAVGGIDYRVLSYNDSTGETAITPDGPDPVRVRYRRASRELARAARALEIAWAQFTEPAEALDNDAWCAACATVKHDDGTPYLTPPTTMVKGASDVGGRLREPAVLCSWHYNFVRAQGELPPRDVTVAYVTKGRAPRRPA